MLQSAIFADLQANSFGIPTVRFVPSTSLIELTQGSFSAIREWLRGAEPVDEVTQLSAHLRRDIGLTD